MDGYAMDFGALTAFVAVARTGSMTAAATAIGLSQPGVSRQIQRLEDAVGVSLLNREGRQLRLTPAGERFRAYAETALAQHEAVLRELRGEAARLGGDLRIGASSTPGEFLVPQWVAAFVALHPGVRPEIAIADTGIVEDAVRAHRYDLGFVGACLQGRGLEYTVVADDEVVLAVPADHPFASRGAVTAGRAGRTAVPGARGRLRDGGERRAASGRAGAAAARVSARHGARFDAGHCLRRRTGAGTWLGVVTRLGGPQPPAGAGRPAARSPAPALTLPRARPGARVAPGGDRVHGLGESAVMNWSDNLLTAL